jgi:hypothetical protein
MYQFHVAESSHKRDNWIIGEIAKDFELLDVWEYPIAFHVEQGDSLYKFRKYAIEPALRNAFDRSLSGVLFLMRGIYGKIFCVDSNINKWPVPGCTELSLGERLNDQQRKSNMPDLYIEIRSDTYLDFRPVYAFENETLDEISNSTEHTLMHYSWFQRGDHHVVQMASYCKHRNSLGKYYVSLIKPFRHHIVYPHLFNQYVSNWNKYKEMMRREAA